MQSDKFKFNLKVNETNSHYKKSKFAVYISQHPCVVILGVLFLCFAASGIAFTAASFNVSPEGNFYPRSSTIAENYDAFLSKTDDDSTLPVKQERTEEAFMLEIYYESKKSDNIINENLLEQVKDLERKITLHPDFQKFCLLAEDGDGSCVPWLSTTFYFYDYPDGDQIKDIDTVVDGMVQELGNGTEYYFEMDFSSSNRVSKVTRSHLKFGLPLPGYDNSDDQFDKQYDEFYDFITLFTDDILKASNSELKIGFFGDGVTDDVINSQITADIVLSLLAIFIVFFLMVIQTWSFFLSFMGMSQILLSAPVAYFIYRFIFQLTWFTSLNFMAIFVLLGVGADGIFVFTDAWKQSRCVSALQNDLELRVSYVWLRASKALLVTSFTTFAAFLATAASALPTLQVFGTYSAIMILVNYVLCISWYAAAIVYWHGKCEYSCCCLPEKYREKDPMLSSENDSVYKGYNNPRASLSIAEIAAKRESQDLSKDATEQLLAEQVSKYRAIERFCFQTWAPFLRKFAKVIVCVFLCITILMALAASRIKTPNVQSSNLPAGHPLEAAADMQDIYFAASEEDQQTDIFLVFGIKGIDREGTDMNNPDNRGKTIFDDSFDLSSVESQIAFYDTCLRVKDNEEFVLLGQYRCVLEDFRAYRRSLGLSEIVTDPAEFHSSMYTFYHDDASEDVRDDFGFSTDLKVSWVVMQFVSTLTSFSPSLDERNDAYKGWVKIIDEVNAAHLDASAEGIANGYQTSYVWVWLKTDKLLLSISISGLISSLMFCFVTLLLATGNYIVCTIAFFNLCSIVAVVLGLMTVYGWHLEINECISIVVLAGLAVDYVVHLAIAYSDSLFTERYERTRQAITELGISVTGGALTSISSTFFFFFAAFPVFFKFGVFIFTAITVSFIFAVVLFPCLMILFGPVRDEGQFYPYLERVFEGFFSRMSTKGNKYDAI